MLIEGFISPDGNKPLLLKLFEFPKPKHRLLFVSLIFWLIDLSLIFWSYLKIDPIVEEPTEFEDEIPPKNEAEEPTVEPNKFGTEEPPTLMS